MQTDPLMRFSDRARSYALARPDYPPRVLDALEEEAGISGPVDVADVGSGTGIFTRLLLDRGYRVQAVEPNREMRLAAEEALGGRAGFRSVDGRAEATSLGDASVDLVTTAQALHWFDADLVHREWARILRPPGWVAVVYNDRRSRGTPFDRAYEASLHHWGGDEYRRVRTSWDVRGALERLFGAGGWRERAATNTQRLDRSGLEGRLVSSSYLPGPGTARHTPMVEAAGRLFDAHQSAGVVEIDYETRLYIGVLRGERTRGGGGSGHG